MIYDEKTELKLKGVFPRLADEWRQVRQDFWDAHQVQIKVADGYRSFAQQWADYGNGRLKDKNGSWIICDMKKVVTYAKAGQSYHQYGLALDSCFMGSDPFLEKVDKKDSEVLWSEYGRICKLNGLEWGGDWKHPDRPHCQKTLGLSFHELQIIYEDFGLKTVWNKCETLAKCGSEIV